MYIGMKTTSRTWIVPETYGQFHTKQQHVNNKQVVFHQQNDTNQFGTNIQFGFVFYAIIMAH